MHIRGTLVCSYRDVSENSRCMYYLKVHYLFALRESSVYYHIFKGTFVYIGREREREAPRSFLRNLPCVASRWNIYVHLAADGDILHRRERTSFRCCRSGVWFSTGEVFRGRRWSILVISKCVPSQHIVVRWGEGGRRGGEAIGCAFLSKEEARQRRTGPHTVL